MTPLANFKTSHMKIKNSTLKGIFRTGYLKMYNYNINILVFMTEIVETYKILKHEVFSIH